MGKFLNDMAQIPFTFPSCKTTKQNSPRWVSSFTATHCLNQGAKGHRKAHSQKPPEFKLYAHLATHSVLIIDRAK